ncbi:hypothetical protein [Nitrosovibrio sp. Nv4]|uniref:hypothetical protein n=1 Tax=Nitrosovibrio sp. Nv4 TaxID=1945880 RepID=UPI000BDA1E78|nr:hypothetical protein [Nitrosovibrio sp. Nv4]SOD42604.1 hypothetical protein SAMN06298226_2955 [Nitrosovibrio sp. Nv4]
MDDDKEPSPEDFPVKDMEMIDAEMVGGDTDDPLNIPVMSIRARVRQMKSDAEGGDADEMIALLKFAERLSEEIKIDTETRLVGIALASLISPIKHLLQNKKAMLAAFGIPRKKTGRRKSKETEEGNKDLAKQVDRYIVNDNTLTLKEAKDKVLTDIDEFVDIKTVERAYKKYGAMVAIERILDEKYRDKKKQQ